MKRVLGENRLEDSAAVAPSRLNSACDPVRTGERLDMLIAWTTVANRADADHIATTAIARNLAICVQIDGPITSHYRWEGRDAKDQEFRLSFKVLPSHAKPLEEYVVGAHPYDTPEWIVVQAEHVGEKYLSWAKANSTTPPL